MTDREPQSLAEHITANSRPQPAIPAVLAMFLIVLLPVMSARSGISDWQLWLVAAGLVISAGLAIAAGFCSLAPHAVWTVLAVWANSLMLQAGFTGWHFALLYFCFAAMAVMFIVQLWRIRTRRFVPTIREHEGLDDEG